DLSLLGGKGTQHAGDGLQVEVLALGCANGNRGNFVHRLLDFVATASRLVDEYVVHDGKQPCPQVASGTPQIELVPRPLQRVLNQVVRDVAVADKRSGVAAQPGYVLDDEPAVHPARILARGKISRGRPSRAKRARAATWFRLNVPSLQEQSRIQTYRLAHLFQFVSERGLAPDAAQGKQGPGASYSFSAGRRYS